MKWVIGVASLLATVALDAAGAIVSTTGAVVVIPAPPIVRTNLFESDTEIRAFAEQQDVTLPSDLSVDISGSGTAPSASSQNLSPAFIPAGTAINSYLIHFDAVGRRGSNPLKLTGSLTFDTGVLGLIVLSAAQNATDAFPGLPTTSYPQAEGGRGLELLFGGQTDDVITLSDDRRTVTLNLSSGEVQDEVRFITAVPEPTAAAAMIAVLLCSPRRKRSRMPHGS